MQNKKTRRKKPDIKAILKGLEALYPDAKPELHFTNPYETLVATMLSAQTTDVQVNKVTPAVFRDFPTMKDMAETSPEILYPYIKSCGFKSKATNIVLAARDIMIRFNGQVPNTLEDLTSLKGVGRKTANVVLANAFGVPAMAVDTHVFRVSNRLGLVNAATVEKTEQQLMEVIPRDTWNKAHHWLIFHGRRVCKARNPACDRCALFPLCANPQLIPEPVK
ncbi:MAG: endonuclease III [Christensenellales bacterium]|jgi:endonuclease-3